MLNRKNKLIAMLLIVLTGCGTFSEYESKRTLENKDFSYSYLHKNERFTTTAVEAKWWEKFEDKKLNELIQLAAVQNLDIKIALDNINKSRALYGLSKFDYFPTATASAGYTNNRLSRNSPIGGALTDNTFDSFDTAVGATWEADFFGKISSSVDNAKSVYNISLIDYRNMSLLTFSELSSAYFELRGLQRQGLIIEENIKNQQQSFDLVSRQFDNGIISRFDLERIRSQLKRTQSELPLVKGAINLQINRISLLVGKKPNELKKDLLQESVIPSLPERIQLGQAVEILRRRPDIQRAEQEVLQAISIHNFNAADLYPRVFFGGSIGLSSVESGNLFESNSLASSFGPSISWAAFDIGRVLRRAESNKHEIELRYNAFTKVVLNALREIDDSMGNYNSKEKTQALLADATKSALKASELSLKRYKVGKDRLIDVLQTNNERLNIERQLVQNQVLLAQDLISLYRSLGGGWEAVSLSSPVASH